MELTWTIMASNLPTNLQLEAEINKEKSFEEHNVDPGPISEEKFFFLSLVDIHRCNNK